jgi:hypothetical protein
VASKTSACEVRAASGEATAVETTSAKTSMTASAAMTASATAVSTAKCEGRGHRGECYYQTGRSDRSKFHNSLLHRFHNDLFRYEMETAWRDGGSEIFDF